MFHAGTVDELFNSAALDGQAFVQKFVEAYNIREMEPFAGQNAGWIYLSLHGYKITIFVDKTLMVESAPKQNEFQFD
ncbi:MAG: hypothetical protein P9L90_03260 [Candidatus Aadella gelida]|nr:hypothetical protein [Candidatus Aadella gelida]